MRRLFARGLTVFILAVSLGAAQGSMSSGSKEIQTGSRQINAQQTRRANPYQVGTASWYGEDFDGRETASGETYNMYALTAAHRSLPLGSTVRVTNLRNGRVVYVRINDRGPIVPGRVIDLSYGAARALSFTHKGLQRVRIDVVQPQQLAQLHPVRPLAY